MAEYKPRVIDSLLADKLGAMGAVLIEGPKFCGKTTTGQAVNINKNAVQFFFVGFELLEPLLTFFLPCGKFIANQSSHFFLPPTVRL